MGRDVVRARALGHDLGDRRRHDRRPDPAGAADPHRVQDGHEQRDVLRRDVRGARTPHRQLHRASGQPVLSGPHRLDQRLRRCRGGGQAARDGGQPRHRGRGLRPGRGRVGGGGDLGLPLVGARNGHRLRTRRPGDDPHGGRVRGLDQVGLRGRRTTARLVLADVASGGDDHRGLWRAARGDHPRRLDPLHPLRPALAAAPGVDRLGGRLPWLRGARRRRRHRHHGRHRPDGAVHGERGQRVAALVRGPAASVRRLRRGRAGRPVALQRGPRPRGGRRPAHPRAVDGHHRRGRRRARVPRPARTDRPGGDRRGLPA